MNFSEAEQHVKAGGEARRDTWNDGQKIRLSHIGDNDFINYDKLDGLIVLECPNRKCDCHVCIFNPSEDDKKAEDWQKL